MFLIMISKVFRALTTSNRKLKTPGYTGLIKEKQVIKNIIFMAVLAMISLGGYAQNNILSGTITDSSTGEVLTGVNIYTLDKGKGAISDLDGNYRLQLNKGTHTIVFSFIGYQKLEKTITLSQNRRLDVKLRSGVSLSEVVVSAERSDGNVDNAEMGTVTLDIESIRNIPAFLGEVDVLRSIQLLPGVQSAGDGNTGFFVRGGNADQNLVILDDAVVFNASHLFNFFSVFNSDAISDLKLYKGGIHPEYGGRLSSVLDIRMKDGNMNRYKLNGGLGLISSRLTLEGPIQNGRSAFMVSGRRTYADLFLKLSSDETQRDTQLFFYDLNTRLNYTLNDKNRLFLSGYFGRDVTMLSDLFGFDWGNITSSLRWNRIFSDDFFADLSLLYSNYQFNISGDIGPATFRWNSMLHNINLKADFNLEANNNNLSFGVQSIYHNLDPGRIRATIEGAAGANIRLSASNALEHGLYLNNEQRLWDEKLVMVYGLRGSAFQIIGPGIQYTYDRSDPLQWQVQDTLPLVRGQFYDTFAALEPRLSIRYKFNDRHSIKGSYNRMTQYIQQAQSAQSVAPYDVWFAASNNVLPQYSDQVSLGYFRNFFSDLLETSLEVYYKDMKNISDIIDNGDILGNELLESQLRTGKGRAYGTELLLQKQEGRISGFVGYTWAIARREIEEINNGRPYYAPNDRRHDLSLSGSYQLSSTWMLGMNFVYASGTAFTLPTGKIYYQGAYAPIYAERNSNRLPDYHRMDLSVTYTPVRKDVEGRRFQSSWNFSVFNAYGRANPISVSFAESEDRPGQPNSSFFYIPGPIPAITWNFNF